MNRKPIADKHVTHQLLELGVIPGGVVLVHCAFSRVKPVEQGPLGLILALQAALGPAVAYLLATDNVSGLLSIRLRESHQPMIRTRNRFSGLRPCLLTCI